MPPTHRRPYLYMFLVALLIRVTVTHFLYHEWLDPFVLEHWAFGRIGRSLALGQGFGNPIADTGPSALLPPVYPYILAGIFKLFGIYKIVNHSGPGSQWNHLLRHLHPGLFPGEKMLRRSRRKMGRMGLGTLALRHLLRSRLGLVHSANHAAALLPVSLDAQSRR